MTILVTGANGLVGRAVVNHLQAKSAQWVVPITRDECDLCNTAETIALFARVKPAIVFHAAAKVFGIMGNMRNQGLSYLQNTMINTNVVEASRLAGVKKIVAMGTNAVYPYPPKLPFKEYDIFNGRPHSSESGYAHAKRGMLAMLEAYEESYGIEWAYIVACNLFGPRDKFDPENGHVIPSLIRKFHEAKTTKQPVIVWGDGSARRNFFYIEDMARAAMTIIDRGAGAINVGDGKVWSIRQIVEKLIDITEYDRVEWDATKPNGQLYREASLARLTALGFAPAYTIDEGLRATWEGYSSGVLRS